MARLTPETKRFLWKAVAGLPFQKRKEVRGELRAHLEDAIEVRTAQGAEQAAAEQDAVTALGDVETLNRELIRAHFGKKWLFQVILQVIGGYLTQLPRVRVSRAGLSFWKYTSKYRRQSAEGRYDEIIERLEGELESQGPSLDIHQELGLAYNAIGAYESALSHLQAEVELLKESPEPRLSRSGQNVWLAGAYRNLAGVLKSLGRDVEAEEAVRAGLAANDKNLLLNYQQADFCLRRGDLDGTFHHLTACLKDDPDNVGNLDQGKTLLHILCTDRFDKARRDPRFSALVQRAYGELDSIVEPLASDSEAETALQDRLAEEGKNSIVTIQQARRCLEQGDLDGAFDHLEAFLSDGLTVSSAGKSLLFFLCAFDFDSLRNHPRFDHLLLRAHHHPQH